MENESSPEHQTPGLEISLDELSRRLGFVENDELRAVRELAVEASSMGDTERVKALLSEYQLHGEELVSNLQGSEYIRGQIGLIVAKAALHRDAGDVEAFLEDIKDAKDYAYDMYEDETVSVLEKAPSIEIARLLAVLGEEYGFDDETINEIAAEPYSQAFEMAYGYLMQAGIDADEVLSAFMRLN